MRIFSFGSKAMTAECLHKQFPSSTIEECQRFVAANPRDAAEKMSGYLEWRERNQLDNSEELFSDESDSSSEESADKTELLPYQSDSKVWEEAVRRSILQHVVVDGNSRTSMSTLETAATNDSLSDTSEDMPEQPGISRKCKLTTSLSLDVPRLDAIKQCVFQPRNQKTGAALRDVAGHQLLYHIPARLYLSEANSEFYSEVMALYIANMLDRCTDDMITFLIDVRPCLGFPNPPALSLVGFIRHVANSLQELNPNRLHQCIIFPVPRAAVYMWRMIAPVLDSSLRKLITLVPGGDSRTAPIPYSAMDNIASKSALQQLEDLREKATAGLC